MIYFFRNLYYLVWAIYPIFNSYYASTGGTFLVLLFFGLTGLYCSLYVLFCYRPSYFFRAIFIFVLFLSLYGFYSLFLDDPIYWKAFDKFIPTNRYVAWLYTSMLGLFPTYLFAKCGYVDEYFIKKVFYLFVFSSVFVMLKEYRERNVMMDMMNRDGFTNTTSYVLLSLMPFILLFKQKIKIQYLLLVFFVALLVLSFKRGAIFLGFVSTAFYMFFGVNFQNKKQRNVALACSIVFFLGLFLFVSHLLETNAFFNWRVEKTLEGYSSGRDVYARVLMDYFVNETNSLEFFWGSGAMSTLSINVSFAHNDWIALLIEQGLVGVFLYVLYWCFFVYTWLKLRNNKQLFTAVGMLLFIGLGKTFFSVYYLPFAPDGFVSTGYYAVALGYFLALSETNIQKQNDFHIGVER